MPDERPRRATALRYAEGSDAPEVVATGAGELAKRILDAAEEAAFRCARTPRSSRPSRSSTSGG